MYSYNYTTNENTLLLPVSYTHLPIVFGEDRLRERGSLPATFYVLTRVILLPCSLKKWKYGDGKENRVRDYCRI